MLNYASLYTNEKDFVDEFIDCLSSHADEVGITLLQDEVALHDAVASCLEHSPFEEAGTTGRLWTRERREPFLDGAVGAVARHAIDNGFILSRGFLHWLHSKLGVATSACHDDSDGVWVPFHNESLASGHRNLRTGEIRVWSTTPSPLKE